MPEIEKISPTIIKESPISDFLAVVVVENKKELMTVGEIKTALHKRGFGILMTIAAIPICLPVPVPPGYTTLFSIPLFILSIQMVFGLHSPWLPSWIEKRYIKRSILEKIITKADPWLKRIEIRMQPRMTYISIYTWERIIGIFSFVFALAIALPLPLTNFLPGCGILIMSLALLNRDGITILIGMIIGTIGIGFTMIVLVMIWMGIEVPSFY